MINEPLVFPMTELVDGEDPVGAQISFEAIGGGRLRLVIGDAVGAWLAAYEISAEVAALLPTAIDEARTL